MSLANAQEDASSMGDLLKQIEQGQARDSVEAQKREARFQTSRNDQQKLLAEKILQDTNQRLSGKVVTKISLLKNYCPAEEHHQKYLEKR